MRQWIPYLQRNWIISVVIVLCVACSTASNPTRIPPTLQPPTSTPFPTPQPQFATVTVPSVGGDNLVALPTLPTSTPQSSTATGNLSAQGEAVTLYNGPQGSANGEANDGVPITILGRSDDGQWIEVRLSDAEVGWVQAANINADVSMSSLPITGYVPLETPTPSPDAIVRSDAAGLRLRTQPNTTSNVLGNLEAGSVLTVVGRNTDGEWLQVIAPNRQRGWAMTQFMEVYVDVLRLPVTFGADPTTVPVQTEDEPTPIPTSQIAVDVITNITSEAQNIFDRGLSVGNRPNVFSKVGDSLSVATWVMYPIGWGQYELGQYSYLRPVIDNFSSEIVRDGNNSFSNITLAADNGWSTVDLLNPEFGNPEICGINETPIDCEYRVTRPSISLILVGTNDVSVIDGLMYRSNLETILDKTIARSILPVLSTLPQRVGYESEIDEFNDIIRQTARQYQIPIWEYHNVMETLPNQGLDEDGVHPSYPPWADENWAAAANFSDRSVDYGYTMRNLTALQVLDAIWRQVVLGETP